jgi:signal transduction histidine kinase
VDRSPKGKVERGVLGLASQAALAIESTRFHEQREQLIEQLREADRRKDAFLAMLGHELRNPLAAMGLGPSRWDRSGPPKRGYAPRFVPPAQHLDLALGGPRAGLGRRRPATVAIGSLSLC